MLPSRMCELRHDRIAAWSKDERQAEFADLEKKGLMQRLLTGQVRVRVDEN
jgi:hypothetical protein